MSRTMTTITRAPAGPETLTESFERAWAAGDTAAIARLYAPGAVVTLAGGRAAVGRDAIRRAFEAALAAGVDLSVADVCEPLVTENQVITSHHDASGRLHTQIAVPVDDGYLWVLDGTRLRDLARAQASG